MLDVNQIMEGLASMVHEQGDTIGEMLITCPCLWCLHVHVWSEEYFVLNLLVRPVIDDHSPSSLSLCFLTP